MLDVGRAFGTPEQKVAAGAKQFAQSFFTIFLQESDFRMLQGKSSI